MIPFRPSDNNRGSGNTPCITIGKIPACLNDFIWFDDCDGFDAWLFNNNYRRATIEDIRLLCDKLYQNGEYTVSYKPIDGDYDEFKSFQYNAAIQGNSGRIFVSHDIGSGYVWDDNTFETAHFAEIENFDIRTGNPIKSWFDYPLTDAELAMKVGTPEIETDTVSKIQAIITQNVSSIPVVNVVKPIQAIDHLKKDLYETFDLVNHPANANGYIWLVEGKFNPIARFECNINHLDCLADYKRSGFHRIKCEEITDYILTTYKIGSIIRHEGSEWVIKSNDWCIPYRYDKGYYDESPAYEAFNRYGQPSYEIPGYQIKGTYFAPIVGFTDDIESKPTNVVTSLDADITDENGQIDLAKVGNKPNLEILSDPIGFMIDDPIEIDSSSYANAYRVNGKAPFARCMDECGLPNKGAIELLNTLTFGTSGMSNAQFNQSNFNKLSFQIDDELE